MLLGAFGAIRRGERRDTLGAFAVLFFLHASHAVLETARDALFLGRVPAERLPLVYVGLALVSLVVGELHARVMGRAKGKRALALSLLVGAVITLGFFFGVSAGTWVLYVLYVWPAVLAGVVVLQFWTLLGDVFSIGQAKRVYAAIGVGSIAGAIAGNALASALGSRIAPEWLLAVATIGLTITAGTALALRAATSSEPTSTARREGLATSAAYIASDPFARRIVLVALTSAMVITLADYLFKSTIAAEIPREQLGSYFARVYLALNALSLVSQAFLAHVAIRRLGVPVAAAVLPLFMLIASIGPFALPILPAVLVLKGAEGALRHSLHRTAFELLAVPLPGHARGAIKRFVEIAGQRGGQAIASFAILGLVALPHPVPVIAAIVVVLAATWLFLSLGLRRRYVELFRKRLGARPTTRLAVYPELDAASLETVTRALEAEDDHEVLAAMEVLERDEKAYLVPEPMLFHRSENVVRHALALFARTQRASAMTAIERLLEQATGALRATAIAVRAALSGATTRDSKLADETPEARAAEAVCRVAFSSIGAEELEAIVPGSAAQTRVAIAEAIAVTRCAELGHVLGMLAGDADRDVQLAACEAMARVGGDENVRRLVMLLGRDETHGAARDQLSAMGVAALPELARAMRDPETGTPRRELPAVIARSDPQQAAQILVAQLATEERGQVRYRIIRALEGLVARHPDIELDAEVIHAAIAKTITKAYRYLDYALLLEDGAARDPELVTPGHRLLRRILDDKRDHAVGRLFRLLGLAIPSESFVRAHRGLTSDRAELRAASVELLDNVLPARLRGPVLGLVDDLTAAERFERAADVYRREKITYGVLLERLSIGQRSALGEVAGHLLGELQRGGRDERTAQ